MQYLKLTKPILYETNIEKYPYAYAGTCFPIKWKNILYIITAKHCIKNHKISEEDILYPNPNDSRDFLAFNEKYFIEITSKDREIDDVVILKVAATEDFSKDDIINFDVIDISKENNITILRNELVEDLFLRGYPFELDSHEILYDEDIIRQRAYTTNGFKKIKRSNLYEHCYNISFIEPIPEGISPNGMSGSPIFALKNNRLVFCGMVTKFNEITKDYLIIGAEVIKCYLERININL
jgi:hypothetical protein